MGTNIYANEIDENNQLDEENKIINITDEFDEDNTDNNTDNKLSEEEMNELKQLRKDLFDLCYSIFDILCNDGFKIDNSDKNELKNYIDDTLLWLHIHEKITRIEYKQKIDEVNDICDKILKEYEQENKELFSENELLKNSHTAKDELENMAITLKILLDEKKIMLKSSQVESLNKKLNEIFKIIYENNPINSIDNQTYIDLNNEFNLFCESLYNNTQGINFNVNVLNQSNIILGDDTNGTDIETLLRLRQEEQEKQLIIDTCTDSTQINKFEDIDKNIF